MGRRPFAGAWPLGVATLLLFSCAHPPPARDAPAAPTSAPMKGGAAPVDRAAALLQQLEVAEGWRRHWIMRDIAALGPDAAPKAAPKLLQLLERGAWDDRPPAAGPRSAG